MKRKRYKAPAVRGCEHSVRSPCKDSRIKSGRIVRRRLCEICGQRFSTFEILEGELEKFLEEVAAAREEKNIRAVEQLAKILGVKAVFQEK